MGWSAVDVSNVKGLIDRQAGRRVRMHVRLGRRDRQGGEDEEREEAAAAHCATPPRLMERSMRYGSTMNQRSPDADCIGAAGLPASGSSWLSAKLS